MGASIFHMINPTPRLEQEGAALSVVIIGGDPNSADPLPLPQQLLFPGVHPIVQDGLKQAERPNQHLCSACLPCFQKRQMAEQTSSSSRILLPAGSPLQLCLCHQHS